MEVGFTLFGKFISLYMVMGATGLIFACLFCAKRHVKYEIPREDVLNLAGYAVIGALIGSKLLALIYMMPQVIKYWDQINWNKEILIAILVQGFVFYGGLAGVLIAFYIYCKQYKLSFENTLEMIAPAIPLFHTFGRIGCYTAGCCGGTLSVPLQLVEASMNATIFIALWVMQNRGVGKTIFWYFIFYGAGRFVLEFFRIDAEKPFLGPISASQWISIAMVGIAVWILIKSTDKSKE